MNDTLFRTKSEEAAEKPLPQGIEPTYSEEVEVDVPYSDYENTYHHPFSVDYFDIGKFWNVDKAYTTEINKIEDYLKGQIKENKVANSLEAVKAYFKDLELTVGVKPFDPLPEKMSKIISYIETMTN